MLTPIYLVLLVFLTNSVKPSTQCVLSNGGQVNAGCSTCNSDGTKVTTCKPDGSWAPSLCAFRTKCQQVQNCYADCLEGCLLSDGQWVPEGFQICTEGQLGVTLCQPGGTWWYDRCPGLNICTSKGFGVAECGQSVPKCTLPGTGGFVPAGCSICDPSKRQKLICQQSGTWGTFDCGQNTCDPGHPSSTAIVGPNGSVLGIFAGDFDPAGTQCSAECRRFDDIYRNKTCAVDNGRITYPGCVICDSEQMGTRTCQSDGQWRNEPCARNLRCTNSEKGPCHDRCSFYYIY